MPFKRYIPIYLGLITGVTVMLCLRAIRLDDAMGSALYAAAAVVVFALAHWDASRP